MQTKQIICAGKFFTLYSLDGNRWASDPRAPYLCEERKRLMAKGMSPSSLMIKRWGSS